ncbi:toxin-antitoxin system HicB family antitoxin [Frankia sp. AgPm24]|uniref:Toxin-antitoxin system HicB family antitoxin n=1 Tax=Frankia umida TaxID=573489 RepID=A0ABT0JZ79_9ACTN|nr:MULTISPECIES: toxin-antitoxin system HicB family antitoxin [Frankia]MCK9876848.1 toxin-antitoxin system HicB family antitoxin [Frankia umida]MCK9923568.1 toxin-antitoxin system HicB family antitoxin [Frankia sp. AgPm24]
MIRTITLRLPEEIRDSARRHAATDGVSMNTWLIRLIDAEISHRATNPDADSAPSPATVSAPTIRQAGARVIRRARPDAAP